MAYRHEKSILKEIRDKVGADIDIALNLKSDPRQLVAITQNELSYYYFNISSGRVSIRRQSGFPKMISRHWAKVPESFDAAGYINIGNSYRLILFKGRQFWFFNEQYHSAGTGYPKNINDFELFRNKSEFDHLDKIDAVFYWHRRGKGYYNCFISANKLYLIPWNDPSRMEVYTTQTIFKGLPGTITSATKFHGTKYIFLIADYQGFLYDEEKDHSINIQGDIQKEGGINILEGNYMDEVSQQKQIKKMQTWCHQLYQDDVYSKEDYNDCIRKSRMIGFDTENVNPPDKELASKDTQKYELGIHDSDIIRKQKKTVDDSDPVYLISQKGVYLIANQDNTTQVMNEIKEPMNRYTWYVERLSDGQVAFKNDNNHYLQYDNGTLRTHNEYVGPLSRWKLKDVGSSYSFGHIASGKYLKAKPLSMGYYSPTDNMIWDIVPQKNEIFKRYNKMGWVNHQHYILETIRVAYNELVKIHYHTSIEKDYMDSIRKAYDEFKKLLKDAVVDSATAYYLPPPPSPEMIAKDPQYRTYYNNKYAWTRQIRPNVGTIYRIIPEIPVPKPDPFAHLSGYGGRKPANFDKPPKTGYARYEYNKKKQINGTLLYNQAERSIQRQINFIERLLDKELNRFQARRARTVGAAIARKKAIKEKHYRESLKKLDNLKNILKNLIKKREQKREILKSNIQTQLGKLHNLKEKGSNMTDKLQKYQDINLENEPIIKKRMDLRHQTKSWSLMFLVICCLWLIALFYFVWKNHSNKAPVTN